MILPGHNELVATGVQIAIPEGFAGFVDSRSGLAAKHQITVLNSPGAVDSDYRGEVMVNLHNAGRVPFEVEEGDRIAQLIVQRVELCNFVQVETLDSTARGTGGHGSTGK